MQDDIQIIRAETACDGQKPTNRALRGCAEWLQQCLRLGYDRDCLDALEAALVEVPQPPRRTDMTDDIQLIRAALAAGPTPGPWQHMNFSSGAAVTAFAGGYDERGPSIAETGGSRSFVVGPGVGKPDAAYIAAVSPDRMERLLARLEAMETALCEVAVAWQKATTP